MKLRTLAVAIIAATVSMSATADVNLSGMARAQYNAGDGEALTTKVELNIDSSHEAGGVTYFGHAQLEGEGADSEGTTKGVTTDDIYVGMKGGFGTVKVGDTDNGCDAMDVGTYSDVIHDANVGGCGVDQNNITYIGSAGSLGYALSMNPNESSEHFAVGVKGTFGAASVSLGHMAGDGVDDSTVLGVSGSFGAATVGVRATDSDSRADVAWVASAKMTSGANTFAIGHGDDNGSEKTVGYWQRDLGGKTALTVEAADLGGDTFGALRLQHSF